MLKKLMKKVLPKKLVRAIQLYNLHGHMKYERDGLYTMHNCNFLNDAEFVKAYQAGKKTGSWGTEDIEWRIHTALWAAKKAFHLDGDFVECGVNRGGLSRSIIEYLHFDKSSKKFFLLDTFESFDVSLLLDSEKEKYPKPMKM
jgi:O-methyltransferase